MKDTLDKIVYTILGILLLVAFRSPTENSENTPENRTITVTGSADMLVPPDEISLEIAYREYWRNTTVNNKKKKMSISEIEKNIIKACNAAGVTTNNITLNTEYAWRHNWNYWYYWYDYYNYLTEKSLTIKVNSSSQLNKVIQNLKNTSIERNGITNIALNGSSNKKLQDYRKLVKEQAIKAAQDKADYLLKAVGEKRGSVINIIELNDAKKSTTTTNGLPHWDPYFGWYGGGSTTVTNNSNLISNSSVSMPSSRTGHKNGNNELGMKPIRLRYEIKAEFAIENIKN